MLWQAALLLLQILATAAQLVKLPSCQHKCGNMTIPYPFGIGEGCYAPGFRITCNTTLNAPMLDGSTIPVLDIDLLAGTIQVNKFIAKDCYDSNGRNTYKSSPKTSLIPPYMFSDTRNKFVAVGCDTRAYLTSDTRRFSNGCISICRSIHDIPNGTCSGIGCCETPIPSGLRSFGITIFSHYNHSYCFNFNPCSYGLLVDQGMFNFNASSFSYLSNISRLPVTLDWAFGNQTCQEARMNTTSFACIADKSHCYNAGSTGTGYRCNCSDGYRGNPYLIGGCEDIDECRENNPCVPKAKCVNTEGNYTCSCHGRLMHGDGMKNGSGCTYIFPLLDVVLGVGFSVLLVIATSSWLYLFLKKKKLIELKEIFFRRNGGLLLQQHISSLHGTGPAARMFTAKELDKATHGFQDSRILGRGGFGTVYKATMSDGSTAAIKKSKITDEREMEQFINEFINEVVVLSHTNHPNVVRLLGCCLETKFPLLVYEFVSNGTLSEHVHDRRGSLSLDSRLRIAAETAGALAYLHSSPSKPIIHRDVKSSNILLDNNLTAKVSDFGASKLVIPLERKGLTALVRGTAGYLDPEYFHNGKFTDKSDVYSFGVVLVELLTGEKPIVTNKSPEQCIMASYFLSCMKEGKLKEVLEKRVVDEGSNELLEEVSNLVRRCLRLTGEERPDMKEVAMELEGLRRYYQHPWVEVAEEEGEGLLGMQDDYSDQGISGGGDDTMGSASSVHGMLPLRID